MWEVWPKMVHKGQEENGGKGHMSWAIEVESQSEFPLSRGPLNHGAGMVWLGQHIHPSHHIRWHGGADHARS